MLEAITRRLAIIKVKIHDICTPDVFHVFTRTKEDGRGFPSGAGVEVADESWTMVMRKAWNGEKLSLLSENVWNGLQER